MDHSSDTPAWDLDALLAEESWVRRIARDLVQDASRADDVTQEVMAAALRQKPVLRGAQLRNWLRTVTRRTAGALRKTEATRARAEIESSLRAEDVAAASERVELHRRLHAGLDALDDGERTVLVWHYLDGLSMRQVGERLGIGELAARKRVQRARGALRKQLGAEFGDERRSSQALVLLAFGGPREAGVPPLALPLSLTAGLLTMKKLGLLGVAVVALVLVGTRVIQRWTAGDVRLDRAARTAELSDATPVPARLEESHVATTADALKGARTAMSTGEPSGPRLIVLDPFGNPCPTASTCWINKFGHLAELFLDERASVELPEEHAGRLFLSAAPGFAPTSIRSDKGAALPLVLKLKETVVLQGRVLVNGLPPTEPVKMKSWGRPLSLLRNEKVRDPARRAFEARGFILGFGHTQTGPSGEFAIDGRHPGESGTILFSPSYRDPSTGQLARPQYSLPGDPLTIRLTRAPYMFGRVVWADDGTPVVGNCSAKFTQASSDLDRDYGPCIGIADESGAFEIALPLNSDALEPPRLTHTRASLFVRSTRAQSVPYSKTIDLSLESSPIDLGTIRLERMLPFRVRVLDAQSQRAEGALVRVKTESRKASAFSDADGIATMICAGAQTIAVYHTGSLLFESAIAELPRDEHGLRTVQLEEGPGLRITTPTVQNREQIANAMLVEVEYVNADPNKRVLFPLDAIQAFGNRATFHEGQADRPQLVVFNVSPQPLEVFGLSVGREIVVRLLDTLGSIIAEHRFTPIAGTRITDIVLMPDDADRNSLSVRLQVGDGLLVPSASKPADTRVFLTNKVQDSWASGAHFDGAYHFSPIAAGVCTLNVLSPNTEPYTQELEFSGAHRDLTVTLTPARVVNVRVASPPDRTVVPDSIYLDGVNGWRSNKGQAEGGNVFEFESVPLLPLTVVAKFGDEEVRVPLLANETEVSLQALVVTPVSPFAAVLEQLSTSGETEH